MRMMKFLFSISMLLVPVLSHIEIIGTESLDWITTDRKERPIFRIVVNGETMLLPLRKAPFCRVADARKCECFILRKGSDHSDWEVASFVKCGHEVRGNFLGTGYQFEIEPKSGSKSGQHIIKKYKLENDPTETSGEVLSDEKQEEVTAKDADLSDGFLKPLPEYGEPFENETGYMTVKFVLSELFLKQTPKIDHTLQNYINNANQYFMDLNLLAIYEGWTQALEPETNLTGDSIRYFASEQYANYDKENPVNVVILRGEYVIPDYYYILFNGFCSGPSGIFVSTSAKYRLLWVLLYAIGYNMGLPVINRTLCDPGEGHRWIMDPYPKVPSASMKWSNCSKEAMQKKVREQLACLRRQIKPRSPVCGDGFLDDGEQCDCLQDTCRNCCDQECKLTEGSECYNGPCCDKQTCMFADNGTQCRAADDSCDIPELCDGKSSECPANFVVANGYECQESPHRSYCFRGKCGSRSDMCEWAFQNGSVAPDTCYELNTKNGTKYGGCGPNFQRYRRNMINYACEESDMYCGKIFCHVEREIVATAKSERYFDETFPVLTSDSEEAGKELCVLIGLSRYYRFLLEDPTFVPNGSECAPDHMCVKQKCVPLPDGCPRNCSGIRLRHPYTGEVLPAFQLDPKPGPREEDSPDHPYIVYLLGSLFMICMIFFVLLKIQSKINLKVPESPAEQPSQVGFPLESMDLKLNHKFEDPVGKNFVYAPQLNRDLLWRFETREFSVEKQKFVLVESVSFEGEVDPPNATLELTLYRDRGWKFVPMFEWKGTIYAAFIMSKESIVLGVDPLTRNASLDELIKAFRPFREVPLSMTLIPSNNPLINMKTRTSLYSSDFGKILASFTELFESCSEGQQTYCDVSTYLSKYECETPSNYCQKDKIPIFISD